MRNEDHPSESRFPLRVILPSLAAIIPLAGLAVWLQMKPEPVPTPEPAPPPAVAEVSIAVSSSSSYTLSSSSSSSLASSSSSPKPQAPPKPLPEKPQLPSLDDSDPAITTSLTEANGTQLVKLLTNEFILRKSVRAIALIAEGGLVSQYRPLNAPIEGFKAKKSGEQIFIDAANYDRYKPYLDSAEAVGAKGLASLYMLYYPLLESAYKELGSKDQRAFKDITMQAIDQLISAPAAEPGPSLKQPSVMYKFKNKHFEQLPEAQKLMLRIGPENQKRLTALLKQIKTHLAAF